MADQVLLLLVAYLAQKTLDSYMLAVDFVEMASSVVSADVTTVSMESALMQVVELLVDIEFSMYSIVRLISIV